jgi:predicted Zn-dependent protease
VGIHSGDTTDVSRLLIAGLYHSAQAARARHDSAAAAELFAEMARRFPDDTAARLLAVESLVHDRNDGKGALAALARISVRADDQRLRVRYGFLKADAFLAAGRADSARATLEQLARDFPDNPRAKDRLAAMK